jgi:hypothetical protein
LSHSPSPIIDMKKIVVRPLRWRSTKCRGYSEK